MFKWSFLGKKWWNGHTKMRKMHSLVTQIRKSIATYWVKTLRSIYPFGLNYHVAEYYTQEKTKIVGVKFPSSSRIHCWTRGIKHKYVNQIYGKEFLFKLNKDPTINLPNTMNFSPTSIASSNKFYLKEIVKRFTDEITPLLSCLRYMWWCMTVRDAIESKFYFPIPLRNSRKR